MMAAPRLLSSTSVTRSMYRYHVSDPIVFAGLVETVPTSMAGVFALIEWQRQTIELDSQALHSGHYSTICDTIGEALRRLTSRV
jgi:hypothetical protein